MATLTTRSMLVSAAPQEGRLGLGSLLRPKQPSRPELSTSSPAGDAARYLDSSAKVFDSVVPGNFAEKLLPKFDNNGKDKVCYEHVGCFSNQDRLTVPTSFPSEPEDVKTKFLLYSRSNRDSPVRLDYRPSSPLGRLTQFQQRKPLKLLVHGFFESGDIDWIKDIKNALLDVEDCNVIIIDWSGGAKQLSYIKAAGNTALVGRQASLLVQRLIENSRGALGPDLVHMVGFSLGGQIAGFFARHFKETTGKVIGRITPLDPAAPLFDNTSSSVSDKDAAYVDVIHTSGGDMIVVGQLGIEKPVGHVDFYPNGGKMQPGCKPLDIACDHLRAPAFFLESIRNKQCLFQSTQCQGGYRAFEKGQCQKGGQSGLMGYFSNTAVGRGIQTLVTNAKPNYCQQQSSGREQQSSGRQQQSSGRQQQSSGRQQQSRG